MSTRLEQLAEWKKAKAAAAATAVVPSSSTAHGSSHASATTSAASSLTASSGAKATAYTSVVPLAKSAPASKPVSKPLSKAAIKDRVTKMSMTSTIEESEKKNAEQKANDIRARLDQWKAARGTVSSSKDSVGPDALNGKNLATVSCSHGEGCACSDALLEARMALKDGNFALAKELLSEAGVTDPAVKATDSFFLLSAEIDYGLAHQQKQTTAAVATRPASARTAAASAAATAAAKAKTTPATRPVSATEHTTGARLVAARSGPAPVTKSTITATKSTAVVSMASAVPTATAAVSSANSHVSSPVARPASAGPTVKSSPVYNSIAHTSFGGSSSGGKAVAVLPRTVASSPAKPESPARVVEAEKHAESDSEEFEMPLLSSAGQDVIGKTPGKPERKDVLDAVSPSALATGATDAAGVAAPATPARAVSPIAKRMFTPKSILKIRSPISALKSLPQRVTATPAKPDSPESPTEKGHVIA